MARSEMLRIRVTQEEKAKIEAKAIALGLSVSEYIRLLMLKEENKI